MPNPRVVLLLHSSIEFDSRVKREAVSLAAAGLDVYVVTPSSTAQRQEYELHGVKIVEQPVAYALLNARQLRNRRASKSRTGSKVSWRRSLPPRDALELANARAALYGNRVTELDGEGEYFKMQRLAQHELQRNRRWAMRLPPLSRSSVMLGVRLHGWMMRATTRSPALFNLVSGRAMRRFAFGRLAKRWNRRLLRQRVIVGGAPKAPKRSAREVSWQKSEPQLADLDIAFGRLLDRLAPAVIQANDFYTLPVAIHAKRRAAARGKSLKVLYDSHEDASGLEEHYGALRSDTFVQVESSYLREVDAIMTVSPQLARRLQQRYSLKKLPAVVLNAPPLGSTTTRAPSLRSLAGVGEDVPLGVYAGGVNKNRGLDLLIEAMAILPDFHAALVLTRTSERTRDLIVGQAVEVGVVDRLHLVPAVLPHEVVAFLSDADLGLIVSSNEVINHQVSLPNKLFEYLHAGLPIVTSNCDALEEFVEEHQVGRVFSYPDISALAESIRWAIDNLASLKKAISPEFLRAFSWEDSQQHLLAVYGDLLSTELPAATIPLDLTVARADSGL